MLPTMKNVQALSEALGRDLRQAFLEAGISTQPPVDLRVDCSTNRIVVGTDCPDRAAIEEKLNSDTKLAEQVRTTIAISSHAWGIQQSSAFQSEISLRFDGGGITVLRDGERAFETPGAWTRP